MAAQSSKLCLSEFDVYGFDLDGCLLKYKWRQTFELMYTYIVTRLSKIKGYDTALLKPFDQAWTDVMFRGIVVDTKRGNFLKVLGDGFIKRAYHGKQEMSRADIESVYPQSILPVIEDYLKDYIPKNEFAHTDTVFQQPLALVFADLVHAWDSKQFNAASYEAIWADVYGGYIDFFVPGTEDFALKFIDIPKNPGAYCLAASEELKQWLKKLKQQGNKTVFLMTSSDMEFAEPMIKFLLGPDAEDYFDFCLGGALKPIFFIKSRPFVDMASPENPVEKIKPRHWYEEGCSDVFSGLLKDFTGLEQPKVLYFGDGLKNDIVSPKAVAHWKTVLILEALGTVGDIKQHSSDWLKQMEEYFQSEQSHFALNPVWGSLFEDDGAETLTTRLIEMYADLAVPWLDYITHLPLDHQFPAFDRTNKQQGYYPRMLPPSGTI